MDAVHVGLEPTSQLRALHAPTSPVLHVQRASINPTTNTRLASVVPLANTSPQQVREVAECVVQGITVLEGSLTAPLALSANTNLL